MSPLTGLNFLWGLVCYKYAAPTALGFSFGKLPAGDAVETSGRVWRFPIPKLDTDSVDGSMIQRRDLTFPNLTLDFRSDPEFYVSMALMLIHLFLLTRFLTGDQ